MSNITLVIGRESFIGTKLVERLSKEGRDVVTFVSDTNKSVRVVPWNRSGYISTITALREMNRMYGAPQDVFILFGRKRDEIFPQESAALIDEVLDYELKALVYLTQELYKRSAEQNKEVAIYFVGENLEDSKRPLGSAAMAGFRAYARSLMSSNVDLYLVGCELVGSDEDGFIDYVLRLASERNEKRANSWLVYPKPSFFGLGQPKR
jgi:hypothetical protein